MTLSTDAIVTPFFWVSGFLWSFRYLLGGLFLALALILVASKLGKLALPPHLLKACWWSCLAFVILIGAFLATGCIVGWLSDRQFYYLVVQLALASAFPLAMAFVALFFPPTR